MVEQTLYYDRVARFLHWTIGLLIIVNIALGIFHEAMPRATIDVHKSIGFTVLALSLFRLAWRLTHPAPPLPASIAGWERFAAHGLHWIFYALMIIMPMTGWAFSSAGKYPLTFFFLFDIPKLAVEKGSGLAQGTHNAHVVLGYAWGVLLIGHIGAALRHQYMLRNNVLSRMWPGAPGAV